MSDGKVKTLMVKEEETGGTKSQTKNISHFVSDLRGLSVYLTVEEEKTWR